MDVQVRNLKTWEGSKTTAYQVTLYIDGVRAVIVTDEGHGKALRWRWIRPDLADSFRREAESFPAFTGLAASLDGVMVAGELYVAALVDEVLSERRLRGWCRTRTVFRLPDDAPSKWRILNVGYSATVRAELVGRYGASVEIANDRFTARSGRTNSSHA